jgi:hypothetical protein
MIHGDSTTAKVTTTTCRKKATPALEHPATVDGTKDKNTSTLMQLKCPPEVETQQNASTEVTQTLLQLKDPPVFETWQHGTPDAALTLLRLKEAPEIDTLQHAIASSIASQLKDNNDYNSCVEWAVAATSAGCDAECDSNIEVNFEPLAADGLKKPAYKDNELFQDDTPDDNAGEDMEYYCVNSKERWGHSLSSGGPFCFVELGWKVTTIQTREATTGNDDHAEEIVSHGKEKVADEDKASFEEDDADRKVKAVCQCTPIKSRWIVPLLLNEIAEKPNMSNAEKKHVIAVCKYNGQG